MGTSYSTGYQVKLIGSGLEAGSWGTSTNENLSRMEDAVGGSVAVNVTSPPSGSTWTSGSLTLAWLQQNTGSSGTTGSTAVGSGRARVVVFGDAGSDLGGTVTVQVRGNSASDYPDRMFYVKNSLSGSRSLNLDLNGSADYVVRSGRSAALFTSATAKGTGTVIAANSVNNVLAYPQVSNLDFQDDTSAEILVADSQTSALKVTDGTSDLVVFDSTNNQAVFAKVDINGGTIDGVSIGNTVSLGNNNLKIGAGAGASFGSGTDRATALGDSSMGSTSALLPNDDCTAVGFESGKSAINASSGTFIGSSAGETSEYNSQCTYVGRSSGQYVKGTILNSVIGNTGLGAFSLRSADDGADTGDYNTGLGAYSLQTVGSNTGCTSVGAYALGMSASGSGNVALGYKSMYDGSSVPSGSNNISIGSEAMKVAVGAASNVCIGTNSGYALVSGNANVMIGYESGKSETGSNKLYIENSDSATPLIYGEFDNDKVQINSAHASNDALTVRSTSGSYAGSAVNVTTTRAANAAFNFFEGIADSAVKFKVDGTGSVYNDTGTYSNPADYADMFEWEDGNTDGADRIGITVVMTDSGKIRPSRDGDKAYAVFGAVTGTACMVGNSAWSHWHGKYLKDDYGRMVYSQFESKSVPVLNPDYDSSLDYIPRAHRSEWAPIGMVGRIHIKTGQATNSSWRPMSPANGNAREWMVR